MRRFVVIAIGILFLSFPVVAIQSPKQSSAPCASHRLSGVLITQRNELVPGVSLVVRSASARVASMEAAPPG